MQWASAAQDWYISSSVSIRLNNYSNYTSATVVRIMAQTPPHRGHGTGPLLSLNQIFARAAIGDFSVSADIPKDDEEFTELYVGARTMLTILREKSEALTQAREELKAATKRNDQLTRELIQDRSSMRLSQSRRQAILASIGEGLIIINQRGLITMINDKAQAILNVTAAQVIGKTMTRVFTLRDSHDTILPPKQHPVQQVLSQGSKFTNRDPYYFHRADKTKFPIAFTLTPLMENAKIAGAIFLFRDISREKKVDDAKNEFISLASHQLRTPLTAIQWYMERLLRGRAGQLTAKQKEYIHEVYQASRRMTALVQSLLNVSRLELGTYTLEEKITNVTDVAHAVVKEFLPSIIARGQQVTERYANDMPLLTMDPQVLYIALQNLVGNAVKYTPIGGKIYVKIALQSKSLGAAPDHLIVSVVDNGFGIPKAAQPEIFKKLFRADNIKELDTDGNGLGLYITKSILAVANGKIWFESKEGKGSSFYVLLPLTKSLLK